MVQIRCPYCGPRDGPEFQYGGQAHVAYPAGPEQLSGQEWTRFLFVRDNSRGRYAERWNHAAGCRRWFNVIRDTGTHEMVGSYRSGEQPEDAR